MNCHGCVITGYVCLGWACRIIFADEQLPVGVYEWAQAYSVRHRSLHCLASEGLVRSVVASCVLDFCEGGK